jgi:hypothetical protein
MVISSGPKYQGAKTKASQIFNNYYYERDTRRIPKSTYNSMILNPKLISTPEPMKEMTSPIQSSLDLNTQELPSKPGAVCHLSSLIIIPSSEK